MRKTPFFRIRCRQRRELRPERRIELEQQSGDVFTGSQILNADSDLSVEPRQGQSYVVFLREYVPGKLSLTRAVMRESRQKSGLAW